MIMMDIVHRYRDERDDVRTMTVAKIMNGQDHAHQLWEEEEGAVERMGPACSSYWKSRLRTS